MKKVWRSPGVGAALIVLLTFLAYIPSLRGGFIWDDGALITENPMIKAANGLSRFWFTREAPDYYPLTASLSWLEWRLWGDHATGYRVLNVLLHAASAILIWMILQRLKVRGAWFSALVFAIHPVNVATVAWISEQKNVLSMLFFAAAILFYLNFDERGRWHWYGLSLMAFLLALLSKTAVVMLPVVLLGCVWWLHGSVRRKDVLCSVPFFLCSAVLGLVTICFQYHALGASEGWADPFVRRLAAAGCAPWFYLYKAILPFDLMVIYPKWEINPAGWVSYVPGALLIVCFTVFWRKRESWGRPLLFGLGYFVVMLLPVLGFINQGFYRLSRVADHWQYYSIVGVIALVVVAAIRIGRKITGPHPYLSRAAGASLVLLLMFATWSRSAIYADSETLWQDNITKNPNAWMAQYNLGVALQQEGRMREAISHWKLALQSKPDFIEAQYNLGVAFMRLGEISEAMAHWEQALRIRPDYAEAHYNLGSALAEQGRTPEAIEHFQKALSEASHQGNTDLVNAVRIRLDRTRADSLLQ